MGIKYKEKVKLEKDKILSHVKDMHRDKTSQRHQKQQVCEQNKIIFQDMVNAVEVKQKDKMIQDATLGKKKQVLQDIPKAASIMESLRLHKEATIETSAACFPFITDAANEMVVLR